MSNTRYVQHPRPLPRQNECSRGRALEDHTEAACGGERLRLCHCAFDASDVRDIATARRSPASGI